MNFLFYSVHVVKLLIAFQVLNSRIHPAFVCLTGSPVLAFYVGPWKGIGGWQPSVSSLMSLPNAEMKVVGLTSWSGCSCFLWMSFM